MTSLIDIYEAAGGTVSEDRKTVSFNPVQMKPFDIVLRVFPGTIEQVAGEDEQVTFDVVLDDEYVFGKPTCQGTPVRTIQRVASLTLPASQVCIAWWERFEMKED